MYFQRCEVVIRRLNTLNKHTLYQALSDLEDSDIPFQFIGGATEATLYGSYADGYVINSTTCPGFEFK